MCFQTYLITFLADIVIFTSSTVISHIFDRLSFTDITSIPWKRKLMVLVFRTVLFILRMGALRVRIAKTILVTNFGRTQHSFCILFSFIIELVWVKQIFIKFKPHSRHILIFLCVICWFVVEYRRRDILVFRQIHIIDYWRILFNQNMATSLFLKIKILGFFNPNLLKLNKFLLHLKLLRNRFYVIIRLFIVIIVHHSLKYMSCRMYISFAISTVITDPKMNSLFLASFTDRIAVFYIFCTAKTFFAGLWGTELYFTGRWQFWLKYLMLMIYIFLLTDLTDMEERTRSTVVEDLLAIALAVWTNQFSLIYVLLLLLYGVNLL